MSKRLSECVRGESAVVKAFVEPVYGATAAALTLLGMHLLGPVVALPIAWLLQRKILRAPAPPFILELPPYRFPMLRDLSWRLWHRTSRFITDAGTIILAMSVLIWALLYFPRPEVVGQKVEAQVLEMFIAKTGGDEASFAMAVQQDDDGWGSLLEAREAGAYLQQSWLGRTGRFVQPLFAPAGFDWKITVGVLASFPAREVIIATLGIIYQLGPDEDEDSGGLRESLAAERWTGGPRTGTPVFTVPVAVAVMVFFAICMQCGATIAITSAETNWKWAWGSFVVMTVMAWLGAVVSYQALTWVLA